MLFFYFISSYIYVFLDDIQIVLDIQKILGIENENQLIYR